MINRMIWAAFGVFMTGALVILGMAWGRYVSKGTSVDTNTVMYMSVLVGGILVYPIVGAMRSRRR